MTAGIMLNLFTSFSTKLVLEYLSTLSIYYIYGTLGVIGKNKKKDMMQDVSNSGR